MNHRDIVEARLTHRLLSSQLRCLLAVGILFMNSCGSSKELEKGSMVLKGVMHRTEIEGGCWVFEANDGQRYELVGEKANQLQRDGLRAKIVVRPRPDLSSVCMIGNIIEVVEIVETH
jgi:hypothetical protein